MDEGDRLSGPGPLGHDRGLGRDVERLPPAARLPPRQRPGGRAARAVPGDDAAADLARRPDLPAHAARQAALLGRRPGQGERLRADDRAGLQARLAGRRPLPEHRRRGRLCGEPAEGPPDPRDRRRQRDRLDRHPPQAAAGGLLERARLRVRGAGARRTRRRRTHRSIRSPRPARTRSRATRRSSGSSRRGTRTSRPGGSTAPCPPATPTASRGTSSRALRSHSIAY